MQTDQIRRRSCLQTGQAIRFVTIAKQSHDPEHILSKLIDDGRSSADPSPVCHFYAVPEDTSNEDLFREKIWKLANPALNDFRSLAEKAQPMPPEEPKFRNLYLNQRVGSTSSLIAWREWAACLRPAPFEEGEVVYLALDISAILELTAQVTGSAGSRIWSKPYFWKPEDLLARIAAGMSAPVITNTFSKPRRNTLPQHPAVARFGDGL